MTNSLKFTVWRDHWLRGESGSLLRDGQRCCLGFLGQAVGYSDRELRYAASPEDTVVKSKWPDPLRVVDDEYRRSANSEACNCIIDDNDDPNIDDATREARLTEQFAAIGIDVEFRDRRGKP